MTKTMTKVALIAVAFIVSIPLGLGAQDEGFYPYSFARLSYVNGTVYVQRTSNLGYEKGEINLALVQGDKMGTESGQAAIHFGRRNYLRLDDNTKVEFAVLPTEGDERIKLQLTEGSAYLRVSQLAVDKGIEVHTPDASFYVLAEGLYRFDILLDRETQAAVREGSLEAATEGGSVLVNQGESVTAADGQLLGDPAYADLRGDGFDNWNDSRDGQLAVRNERQYLPAEMSEYEEELADNGQWVYERGYGNVWVPEVSYSDWRPYLYGRWVWYPVIGWTWVSSEPWGWATYHYGRWQWRFGLGWYWIPRHSWGPAWVHWWWDRDYIGWSPLSWYNRPGLLVDNRFYDRHYDRYSSAHNRAMTVIRRDQLQARDLHRRELGAADRGRIGQVEFRRDQPSLRPVVDNVRPEALAARRALADRPGSRNAVRSVAPSNSLSRSRMRPGAADRSVTRDRNGAATSPGRSAISRPSIRNPESGGRAIRSDTRQPVAGSREASGLTRPRGTETGGRAIRSFPSQRTEVSRDRSAAPEERRTVSGPASRRDGTETRGNTARVSRPEGNASAPARVTRSESTSGRSQSRSYPSRSSVSRAPSRLSSPSSSARSSSSRSSSPSYSRPSTSTRSSSAPSRSTLTSPSRSSAPSSSRPSLSRRPSSSRSGNSYSSPSRSSAPSSSRPSLSRQPSSSRSGSSYSSPSRSSRSSGRTMSAPRSSSSSGRSYSAPRSSGSSSGRSMGSPRSSGASSGRSYSAPRSSGSSSGRASSSGRSGSSSGSSGSSSKSGVKKRK